MNRTMIAALAAAHLAAAACPAQAAELPRQEAAAQRTRLVTGTGLAVPDEQTPAATRAEAAQEGEPRKKKRKSTGEKVLTGAAVVLGVGALAVGGLLIAIFVN